MTFSKKISSSGPGAFTLVEVLIAIAVSTLFGLAAFATNERLLVALKSQKESTAATMMLQERMETFRSLSYSNVCDTNYVSTNVVSTATTSEAALGKLTEQITVSGYVLDPNGTASTHSNQWQRNQTYPSGNAIDTNSTLATNYDLVKVDVVLTWTSANGRTRTRDLAALFGKGNIAP